MRKICIVTGSRAEYGLLHLLMRELNEDSEIEAQLVVTGSHLTVEFGFSVSFIEEDGFCIDDKVEMLLAGDTPNAVCKSLGVGIIGMADSLRRLNPDIVVVLGDRFEIFAVAQVCLICKIPLAHIHGGELTEGAIDDAMRHGITKMAQLHFVAAEEYRRRVIQLGENPEHVYNVGALGIDNICTISRLEKEELENLLGIELNRNFFLITYHPETLAVNFVKQQMEILFAALDSFPDFQLIFTKANSDAEGRMINQLIEEYCCEKNSNAFLFDSLGQQKYLSLMNLASAVIGNSSSGIIEAPFFKTPTVNIGNRQKGRLRVQTIIDCECNYHDIVNGINRALALNMQRNSRIDSFPYGDGGTSKRIKNVLKSIELQGILNKQFYDIRC